MDVVGLPHFLGIGVMRSGSTWLHRALRQVEGLWLPPIKELHYLDRGSGLLVNESRRYRDHLRTRLSSNAKALRSLAGSRRSVAARERFDPLFDLRYFIGPSSERWYTALFARAARRGLLTGEVTPSYARLPEAVVRRVHARNPRMRMVLCLRDPIDRSWSHAVKQLMRPRGLSAEQVPEETIRAFLATSCAPRSAYAPMLRTWRAVFPKEQLLVAYYDDLARDPRAFLARVVGFLGLDPARAARVALVEQPVNAAARELGHGVPAPHEAELAAAYLPGLRELHALVGAPVEPWIARAERALALRAAG